MKNRLLLSFFLIFSAVSLYSQQFSVSGFVRDKESGEALIGVMVMDQGAQRGTRSNENGYFNLIVPAGYRYIEFYLPGYEKYGDSVYLGADERLEVNLVEDIYFEEVYIDPDDKRIPDEPAIPEPQSSTPQMIKNVPPVFGEVDLIKSIQFLPGIQGGVEASSGLHVRGGSPDQNLVQIDGVPVYNINHTFGFFSAFNTESVLNYNLYKGGYPARFGSRLSSVLDITMKDGNNQEIHGNASLSLISFSGYLEGPLYKDKTTFSASFRRTLPGIVNIINPLTTGASGERTGGYFYDGTVKLTHRVDERSKLSLTFYRGKDKFFSEIQDRSNSGGLRTEETRHDEINWGNTTVALRGSRAISKRLYGNVSLSYTEYQFNQIRRYNRVEETDSTRDETDYNLRYFSGIRDFSLKADFEYAYNYRHKLSYGFVNTVHAFAPGAIEAIFKGPGTNIDTTYGAARRIVANEAAVYLEDDIHWSNRLRTQIGLRVSSYFADNSFYYALEPRVSLRYSLSHKAALKLSYTRMNQYLHLLANSGLGLPTDLWLPSTAHVKPESAHQLTASVERTVADDMIFSVEVFYKWLNNVVDYSEGADFVDVQENWEGKVEQGVGRNYGLEVLFSKRYGEVTGILAYTLSWNRRQYEFINNGNWYYYRYDRRHQINFTANMDVTERNTIAFSGIFGTGYPVTFPHGRYVDINGNEVFDYEMKNGYRLRYYLRFDVALTNKRENYYSGLRQEFVISIYNLFNRRNPYFLYVDRDAGQGFVAKEVSIFPLFPSVTYRLLF